MLLLGLMIGYALATALGGPAGIDPSMNPGLGPRTATETTAPSPSVPPPTTRPALETYLIWATGGLPPDLSEGLRREFEAVSIVSGDLVEMNDGVAVVPLDALALDPVSHSRFDPGRDLDVLAPGTVVLGETSAKLRRAGVGDVLTIGDVGFTVAGIAPDEVVGAAEVVFDAADPASPVVTERYALVASDRPRSEIEESVRVLYQGPAPLRIRTAGETPWLRHGDAVVPQVFIKQALGEFSYTEREGATFTQEQAFIDDNIITAEVPILGEVTCHRVLIEMLRGAMDQLSREGLAHLVDPAGNAGCWNPRLIRSAVGSPAGLSRHSWGAAIDLNAPANPVGSAGNQDPRLIEIMLEWGFTWGGEWLVPDPMHFEYGIDPSGPGSMAASVAHI